MMKRLLVFATFVALFSAPARAQSKSAGSSGTGYPTNSGYSGGGGGGFSGGGGNSGPLPDYPPAHFAMNAISGTEDAFSPSTFLPFEQAVAAGKAAAAARAKSPAEAAKENSDAQKAKARVVFVQDAAGNVIPVRR
jgi:hypothetical protein